MSPLLVLALVASLAGLSGSQDAAADPDLEFVFNPDVYDGYQRKFTVDVEPKREECFFLENVQPGHKLNYHFMVPYNLNA